MSIFKQFMEAVDYKIDDAWEHQWASYPCTQVFESSGNGVCFQMAFRRDTQEVIELKVTGEEGGPHYRWINEKYLKPIQQETVVRNQEWSEAYEGELMTDLDVVEDILEKGTAMLKGLPYDSRVTVPLDIDDETLLAAMKAAHALDITFNQYMEKVLLAAIEEHGGVA